MSRECCEDISNFTAFCYLQLHRKRGRYSEGRRGNIYVDPSPLNEQQLWSSGHVLSCFLKLYIPYISLVYSTALVATIIVQFSSNSTQSFSFAIAWVILLVKGIYLYLFLFYRRILL